MRKRQGGQAFILVLILLAIGALLVVPALRLTGTALKSSQIVPRQTKALYAVEAAQEWVLWKLNQPDFADSFQEDVPQTFQFDACGVPVDVTVIMRAVEGTGGVTLATDDVIRPTKSVISDNVSDGSSRTYTYYIPLEQLSDNTSQGLDAVYDILPNGFGPGTTYISGSSKLRVDGGPWESFGDPLVEDIGYGGQIRLRWPNPATYGSENFLEPMRSFAVRQVKEIQFQVSGSLTNNSIHVNWVILDPWDTLSGPQARITVGNPPNPDDWGTYGMFEVGKVAEPEIILPGAESDVKYTISIINHEGSSQDIEEIIDYLPPEFLYTDNSTRGDITSSDPQLSLEMLNGVERQVLRWTSSEIPPANKSFAAGSTKALTFWVRTTKEISGSYYNEVQVHPNMPVPKIVYEIIGPTSAVDPEDREIWNIAYSWNTGAVMVPAYDSEAEADGVTIDANMSFIVGGVIIGSWQVD